VLIEGFRILRVQFLLALRSSLEYRVDFWIHLFLSILWTIAVLLPLWVIFQHRTSIGGWEWYDALFVSGFFTLFLGVIEGMIQPSLSQLVESFRNGNMDLLLLKPVDPQILITTLKIQPWNATDSLAGVIILLYALSQRPSPPSFQGIALALIFFFCGLILIYDIAFLAASLGAVFVKVDNLIYLFLSLLDAARWPTSIFPAGLRILFTFVIPISVMTTFPAEALRGRATISMILISFTVTTGFTLISRWTFRQAMKSYMSAGG
jgi:ABC-2 type transport system permease protein